MREVLDKVVEKIKTHFIQKLVLKIGESVDRYCRAGQATDNRMAHPYFMLDT
jgi:hypothetical protein